MEKNYDALGRYTEASEAFEKFSEKRRAVADNLIKELTETANEKSVVYHMNSKKLKEMFDELNDANISLKTAMLEANNEKIS